MTREEAIKVIVENCYFNSLVSGAKEALDLAIKVLKSEEPCEDCVSRQAVLEKINDWWGITSTSGEPTLCDCIRELPPVTPTRKKGKWVTKFHGFPPEPSTFCSECGFDRDFYIRTGFDKIKFCPNCGAEMEGEE